MEGATASNSLEIVALNDGSMKLVYAYNVSAKGVVMAKTEITLTLSMSNTFDQTKVPTDFDSYSEPTGLY